MPVRVSLYLFALKAGEELAAYEKWTGEQQLAMNMALARLQGYVANGAGENLVVSAADYENFLAERPQLKPEMEADLRSVVTLLAKRGWPLRIHATYDESITRMLGRLRASISPDRLQGPLGRRPRRDDFRQEHRAYQSFRRGRGRPGPNGVRRRDVS